MTLTDLMALRSELQAEAARYQAEIERLRAILDRAEELIVEATLDIDLLDVPDEAATPESVTPAPKQRRTRAEVEAAKASLLQLLESGTPRRQAAREVGIYPTQADRWVSSDDRFAAFRGPRKADR